MKRPVLRILIPALCALFAAGLAAVVLTLPPAPEGLPQQVAARITESGVDHPVTAVLLNFRAYDTLLEIGVLLLAALGALALRNPARPASDPPAQRGDGDPVLRALIQLAVPLMILTGGYLLWAGATRPGGAFQGAAVLAGAGVLLGLARVPLPARGAGLRVLIAAGFAVFLAVALAAMALRGSLLHYPPESAGALILLVEAALTVSIAAKLVSLFFAVPGEDRP
jgi:multisubunit Na+/H+ antiporter MnhB subunit